ncbi:aldo/keto reductase [Candidatus Latescibacterota bacterium]
MERRELGQTGLTVSRLCFGTGTNGWSHRSNQGDLGIDRLARLLAFAHELGITFWDTADQYGTHPHVAAALRGVDRDSVTIATKTVSKSSSEVTADVERFCQELGTPHLDIVLLHCMSEANWPQTMSGAMEALSQCKERGQVRAVGVSCHGLGALQTAASCPWVDVGLVRVNYAGESMCGSPPQVVPLVEEMASGGKGVYGMKVMGGGGDLTRDPGRAIAYAGGVEGLHALSIGMMSEVEITQNAEALASLP